MRFCLKREDVGNDRPVVCVPGFHWFRVYSKALFLSIRFFKILYLFQYFNFFVIFVHCVICDTFHLETQKGV